MPPAADVVVVPDFQGSDPALFEARTLLFLGSWLEHAGAARDWPLHLACIGEPPARVVRAAEGCGALLSVHEPVAGGVAPLRNKLRGFEIAMRTDRLLLLDVDVVAFGDPSPIQDLEGDLAVAPASHHRVRPHHWERVLTALDEKPFETRMLSHRGALVDRLPRRAVPPHHLEPMAPYYNTGVLWIARSRAAELREVWDDYLDRLTTAFPVDAPENRVISRCDQVGFALALRKLCDEGLRMDPLPGSLHANWVLLAAEAVPAGETRLLHAMALFSRDAERPRADWRTEVDFWEEWLLGRIHGGDRVGQARRWLGRLLGERAGVLEIRRLCDELRRLVADHVE